METDKFTRKVYDSCSYTQQLKVSKGPGKYTFSTPFAKQAGTIPHDPQQRVTRYGPVLCEAATHIDTDSALKGLGERLSDCARPVPIGSSCPTGNVVEGIPVTEHTRLTNSSSTFSEVEQHRWNWLPFHPVENSQALHRAMPVDTIQIAKDSHIPKLDEVRIQSGWGVENTTTQDFMDARRQELNRWVPPADALAQKPGNPNSNTYRSCDFMQAKGYHV